MASNAYKRHKTRHRGITYRQRARGTRTYYVFVNGVQVKVDGGEAEALALQAELRGRKARGENIVTRKVTLGTLAEDWYASKGGLRDSTLRDYRADLDNEILPRFGHLKVPKVTADEIARFVRDLSGRGLSGSRIKNILKPLQGTLKLGVRRGLIFQSPFDLLTADERPRETPRKHHEWSPEDINALLAASEALAKDKDAKYDYAPILRMAAYTGLREGEILGLRWHDVDLKKREIHVRHQISRSGKLVEPKTLKAVRTVPLGRDMAQFLRRHRLASDFSTDEHLVFPSHEGTPLNPSNLVNRGFKPALKKAGLDGLNPGIRFHDLRHFFASVMIDRGVSSVVLADVMGHRDSRTTERIYIHLLNRRRTADQVREAMQSAMRQ
jgi:integrase